MTLPLSAHAREAVDRMNQFRQRQRDLQVRRDTAIRARQLQEEAELAAERVRHLWEPDTTDTPPAKDAHNSLANRIHDVLRRHGPLDTMTVLTLVNGSSRQGTHKALRRMEQRGVVNRTVKDGVVVWEHIPGVAPNPPVAKKVVADDVLDFLGSHPWASTDEVAKQFRAVSETASRALRRLHAKGLVERREPRGPFGPAEWRATGDAGEVAA